MNIRLTFHKMSDHSNTLHKRFLTILSVVSLTSIGIGRPRGFESVLANQQYQLCLTSLSRLKVLRDYISILSHVFLDRVSIPTAVFLKLFEVVFD